MQAKYTVLDRLGGGGQAEVFRGISESIQGYKKAVAIKRVLPHLTTNERFVAMFLDEELVDGCDLKELVAYHRAHRASDIGLALYIMAEAARGLHYAHTLDHPYTGKPLGIVHRDVSPPNIMLSKNGEVKVVDFGLAKAVSQLESTDEGVVKGKFSYLSPEAALGLDVAARADVFALGIITC